MKNSDKDDLHKLVYSIFIISVFLLALHCLVSAQESVPVNNTRWISKPNRISQLPLEDKRILCGTRIESLARVDILSGTADDSLPDYFDWRDYSGNWLTSVKNQGLCGSCWAFASIAQTESWWKIKHNKPEIDLDLSEQILISCSDGGCNGGRISQALEFIKTTGIPLEPCLPYRATDSIACQEACQSWPDSGFRIPGHAFVSGLPISSIKKTILLQPVATLMNVYDNFFEYDSGVYDNISGPYIDDHGVLLVGWNDSERYWICKNSWGSDWGENGYFRISWDTGIIGTFINFIWTDLTRSPALVLNDGEINCKFAGGKSYQKSFAIHNQSSEELQYFISVYKSPYKVDSAKDEYPALNKNGTGQSRSWLRVSNRTGRISAQDSSCIILEFETTGLEPGTYRRILCISSNDPFNSVCYLRLNVKVEQPDQIGVSAGRPYKFRIHQNFPNPFNSITTIPFELPYSSKVTICIYNLSGIKVAGLLQEVQPAGCHQIRWEAGDLPSGIYYYQLRAGPYSETKKLILLR